MPQVPHEQWELIPCVQHCSKHTLRSPLCDYLKRSCSSLWGKSQGIIIYLLVIVFVAMSFPACSSVNGLLVRKQAGECVWPWFVNRFWIPATKSKLSERSLGLGSVNIGSVSLSKPPSSPQMTVPSSVKADLPHIGLVRITWSQAKYK